MNKITFVVPSWGHLNNPLTHQPYWEMYYSTIIRNTLKKEELEFEVTISDNRGNKKLIDNIDKSDFFLYWIFKTPEATECFKCVKELKSKYPKSIHIAGGTHVEKSQDECVKIFDSIVVGPGEESFVNAIKDWSFKNGSKIYKNKWQECKFNDYPYPDRSFLPRDRVVGKDSFPQYGKLTSTVCYFSRGCIYKCNFCTLNVPGYLQIKSGKLITEEIKYLKDTLGIEAILLKDEIAIHPNKLVSNEILSAIKDSDIIWRGQTTTQATYDQLKLAKESGCLELAIGIETIDNNVMKIINKSWQTEKQIQEFISNAKKVGIKIKTCLIFGLPGEPSNIVEKTISFIKNNEIDFVHVSGFCPLPGSQIFDDYKNFGIKNINKDWSKHAHLVYKFQDVEDVGLPFEYEDEYIWGKNFKRKEIINNIITLQSWLRDNKKSY